MATSTNPQPLFKAGEIVLFKTTEIKMIVTQIKEDQIQCWYYNRITGGIDKQFFPAICLRKLPPSTTVSPR